jgi:hypothetical protein
VGLNDRSDPLCLLYLCLPIIQSGKRAHRSVRPPAVSRRSPRVPSRPHPRHPAQLALCRARGMVLNFLV